jgi:hypothetical protein
MEEQLNPEAATSTKSELIERLGTTTDYKRVLTNFAGYVLTCKTENTADWMEGLAEEITKVADAVGFQLVYEFDGTGIRGFGVGDET